jgi:RNA polymerase sigma factor (TIGR02999 family)
VVRARDGAWPPADHTTRPRDKLVGMSDVTRLLEAAAGGDRRAAADLLPLVYDELRALAGARMAAEAAGHTLQPTALVHEAYLRLVGSADARRWDHRGHFFAAAAEAMRRVLVDHARKKAAEKRGGELGRVERHDVPAPDRDDRLLALDEALTCLAAEDLVAARAVELRQFAGLGHEDVAATLGITVYEARRKWEYARAWLRDALSD